jgi:ribonuclease PH
MRVDGRTPDQLRPFSIEPGFIKQAMGSALVTSGVTRVICTASVESRTPGWLQHGGWVSAEYAMLPGATLPRGGRKSSGRSKEIQRLIGRSLRAALDLSKLVGPDGPLSLTCDCDVIEADGGTRTAAITGTYVALALALEKLRQSGRLAADPILGPVGAVSVGIAPAAEGAEPRPLLDLCYTEDAAAVVDLNVVMRGADARPGLVEVQGTGEQGTFSRSELDQLLDLAEAGIQQLFAEQTRAIGG